MEAGKNNPVEVQLIAANVGHTEGSIVESQTPVVEALLIKRKQLLQAIGRVDSEVKETQQELGQKLEELKSRRQPLEEALFHLEAFLKIEGWMRSGDEDNSLVAQVSASSKVPIEAARDVLEELGKPTHYRELATKVLASGIFISGQDPAATLLSKMSRDSRFKRYGRGLYGLTSWNLRRTNKKRKRSRSKKS